MALKQMAVIQMGPTIICALFSPPWLLAQSPAPAAKSFMGSPVVITAARQDELGYPDGPATICVEFGTQRQCHTAPGLIGRSPQASTILLDQRRSALLFSAASGGMSGWEVYYALLVSGQGSKLRNLFPEIKVANISQDVFLTDNEISSSPVFVTASFVWEGSEGHYDNHRYQISSYVWKSAGVIDGGEYVLADEFITTSKYNIDKGDQVLASEQETILFRLRK